VNDGNEENERRMKGESGKNEIITSGKPESVA